MRRFKSRWVNAKETRLYNEHNGVVEDVSHPHTPKFICYASPKTMADRIAYALNVAERFPLGELRGISIVLTGIEG